jgi:two-component system phosphate regulon sensor histidine kinase PhoR
MNDKRYLWILYVIVFVILGTITIQVYWNSKNYLTNKQQLINDVQISLDNAIDTYYTNLAEKSTVGFVIEANPGEDFFTKDGKFDSLISRIDFKNKDNKGLDSINLNSIDGVTIFKGLETDSLLNDFRLKHESSSIDSISEGKFKLLTSKIVVSITNDSLKLQTIDTLLTLELKRKNIAINYGLSFKNKETIQNLNADLIQPTSLNTVSKSAFLPEDSELSISFTNATKIILKRILTGILISTLLVLVVISCLFYLLKIIKHQKQLAEVKNDLISNITHEFKTPIATISVALESIKNFNVIDDKEKTRTYLDMSSLQLSKLNIMVEKLLETATLDSNSLTVNKEQTNITNVLQDSIDKYSIQIEAKTINFKSPKEDIIANVDVFHIENAINNIIDNAIKYGGDEILIELKKHKNGIEISISDNGKSLTKANKDKIFEKFYRIPRGNRHDVKGFGIGLYYAKKIIEKHGGTIHLNLDNNLTTFKVSIPN